MLSKTAGSATTTYAYTAPTNSVGPMLGLPPTPAPRRHLERPHTASTVTATRRGSSAGASFSYNTKNQTTSITYGGPPSPASPTPTKVRVAASAGSTTFDNSTSGTAISTTSGSSTYSLTDGQGGVLGERIGSAHYYFSPTRWARWLLSSTAAARRWQIVTATTRTATRRTRVSRSLTRLATLAGIRTPPVSSTSGPATTIQPRPAGPRSIPQPRARLRPTSTLGTILLMKPTRQETLESPARARPRTGPTSARHGGQPASGTISWLNCSAGVAFMLLWVGGAITGVVGGLIGAWIGGELVNPWSGDWSDSWCRRLLVVPRVGKPRRVQRRVDASQLDFSSWLVVGCRQRERVAIHGLVWLVEQNASCSACRNRLRLEYRRSVCPRLGSRGYRCGRDWCRLCVWFCSWSEHRCHPRCLNGCGDQPGRVCQPRQAGSGVRGGFLSRCTQPRGCPSRQRRRCSSGGSHHRDNPAGRKFGGMGISRCASPHAMNRVMRTTRATRRRDKDLRRALAGTGSSY